MELSMVSIQTWYFIRCPFWTWPYIITNDARNPGGAARDYCLQNTALSIEGKSHMMFISLDDQQCFKNQNYLLVLKHKRVMFSFLHWWASLITTCRSLPMLLLFPSVWTRRRWPPIIKQNTTIPTKKIRKIFVRRENKPVKNFFSFLIH
jgi:hypothetical protein